VTKATKQSERIRAKIDASAANLEAGKAVAARLPAADPPEKFSGLIGDYPGLAIAAGLGLGLLAGSLIPRSAGRKLVRGAVFLASTGGELGLIYGKQALHKVDEATREGREMLGEAAAEAAQKGTEAAHKAAEAGLKVAEAGRQAGAGAQRVAEDASGRARDLGLSLVKMAIDTAARLRG
jgi:hypothetical protein